MCLNQIALGLEQEAHCPQSRSFQSPANIKINGINKHKPQQGFAQKSAFCEQMAAVTLRTKGSSALEMGWRKNPGETKANATAYAYLLGVCHPAYNGTWYKEV